MEESSQGQKCYCSNEYNIHHFLRNVCSPSLAELLAKELKNSKYIREELRMDREGTLKKNLFEILTRVSNIGKRNASKNKPAAKKSDGASKTHKLNNLPDNESLLSQLQVEQFMEKAKVDEENEKVDEMRRERAVKTLGKLDTALLLHILTNDVLEFPWLDIKGDLEKLKVSRNSIFHNDNCITTDVQKSIWDGVESVQKYLGKDMDNFQEKKKSYFSSSQNSCCPLMKKLQQEINQNYYDHVPCNNYMMQPTLKHLRRDCQSYEIVENLMKFLKDHRASGSQEPRPILLCGAPGAGKSAILHNLMHAFIKSEDFLLVVLMDWNEISHKTKESFWKDMYCYLMKFSQLTVQKYGEKEVMTVLENYSSKFLFLWDLNLQDTRNRLPHMDRGTWVLSYQGLPETFSNYCVLKVASLKEKQIREVLWSIKSSEEHYNQVLQCYRKCEYKGLIKTPDMVRIFDNVCLGMTDCVPFYRLIQMYINNKIGKTEENQVEVMIKLGQKAFDTISNNGKYYPDNCFADIQSNIHRPFLEYCPSRGYFFKYQVVEDYLAAWYIVKEPKTACKLWLKQATLFKRVFQIACALWCEEGEGLCNNLELIREYLERLFDIYKPKQNRAKKQKNRQAIDVTKSKGDGARAKNIENKEAVEVDGDDRRPKKQKNKLAMEVDVTKSKGDGARAKNIEIKEAMEVDGDDRRPKKQKNKLAMEVGDNNDDSRGNKQKNKRAMDGDRNEYGKNQKNNEAIQVEDEDENDTRQNFVRWVFLSKIVKEHQNNQVILQLFAEMVTRKQTWHFKCKLLSEVAIDNISLVFKHINLTKPLTIKLESGPNVTLLSKLWKMLCSHQGVCMKANVHLVIHYTERNWLMNEKELTKLPSVIVETEAALYITKYAGPLLCSSTPQFLTCLCMAKLKVLDVSVCDLASLREVLAHQGQSLESVIVRLNLKMEEQMIPNTMQVKLSDFLRKESEGIKDLQITYFKDLQKLLNAFEPPDLVHSLKIYGVFIHKNFKLDFRRFTKMKSLFIKFVDKGRLPPISVEVAQSEVKMEIDEDNTALMLPLDCWALQLVLNLHLPVNLERLLMRNLSFCDDSRASLLHSKYWKSLPFQRLILLDTHLSLSQFKSSLNTDTEDITEAMEKKCKVDGSPGSSGSVVKRERLKKQERIERRRYKPEGKELIITSSVQLCKECHHLSCTCFFPGINNNRDTYQDLISLAKEIYSSEILNVSYSGRGIVVRKDMCGDLQVQCPLPFLDDHNAQYPESSPELSQMLEALALAQIIHLSHTKLSHKGATYLIHHVKERKKNIGTIEPFRLTILSCYYHDCSITKTEVQHSPFMKQIKNDDSLQQFNFKCDCWKRCHNFKKSIQKMIFFNNNLLHK